MGSWVRDTILMEIKQRGEIVGIFNLGRIIGFPYISWVRAKLHELQSLELIELSPLGKGKPTVIRYRTFKPKNNRNSPGYPRKVHR